MEQELRIQGGGPKATRTRDKMGRKTKWEDMKDKRRKRKKMERYEGQEKNEKGRNGKI